MANLSKEQKAMVLMWPGGSFEIEDLVEHFYKLGLPMYQDLGSSSNFVNEGCQDEKIDEEPEDLDDEDLDIGEESFDEEILWVYRTDLDHVYEEQEMNEILAIF